MGNVVNEPTTTWPIGYNLIIDTAPIVWVDDIAEIDPEYLELMGLS